MAQLINNLEELRAKASVSAKLDYDKISYLVKRAERKFISDLIGSKQYQAFASVVENEGDKVDEARDLLKEAAACFAMVLAVPVINLQVTNSGTKTNTNEKSDKASWGENRDLIRIYFNTATEAIDAALEIMELNVGQFPAWEESNNYTVFKELFVTRTGQFNDGFFINNNRKTFLSLRPYMAEVEEQYLEAMLGDCMPMLKLASDNLTILRAQKLARLAVISLTISKVATTGTFSFTSTGMMLYAEELAGDKNKGVLSETQLEKLQADRQNSGEEFLKKLKAHLLKHPDIFTCYQDKTNNGIRERIIVKKSGLFL
jgi:hypothetical protein